MFKSVLISTVLLACSFVSLAGDKVILRQSEMMTIEPKGLSYHARMDTGAENSSLHATELEIIGGSAKKMKKNIGKTIAFTTENEQGEKKRMEAKIVDTSTVSNSQGTETRYIVQLPIRFEDKTHKVDVNLRDRSAMEYKLLIGRSFLKKGYVIDVSKKKLIGEQAKINVKEAGLVFNTRIDSGAVQTSLHAIDIHIEDEDKVNMKNNIGKKITFTTVNEKNKRKTIKTYVYGTSYIRNAQGDETRYTVMLNLGQKGSEHLVRVNLRDRTKMGYKLLIGRNWLQGRYLVDVTK
jgi:hypothetical protein